MDKSEQESMIGVYKDESIDDEIEEEETPQQLTAVEQEFIHHIAYDYYGHRMVSCGADQKLKIWQKMDLQKSEDDNFAFKNSPASPTTKALHEFDFVSSPIMRKPPSKEENKEGMCIVDEWVAHTGPIWKVAFAHPQFGQIIASCTESSELFIWEEKYTRKAGTSHDLVKNWVKVASIKVSKDRIQDIRFGPEHVGLKLLVLYKNGCISIYQAKIVNKLDKWDLICNLSSINVNGCNSVDWNPTEGIDMFVVGSNSNKPEIRHEETEATISFKNIEWSNRTNSIYEESKYDTNIMTKRESGIIKVNKVLQFFKFNDKTYEEIYFVGKESDCTISDDKTDNNDEFVDLESKFQNMCSVIDVKFAPCIGRSYTLLASCGSNYRIDFWKLDLSKIVDNSSKSTGMNFGGVSKSFLGKESTTASKADSSFIGKSIIGGIKDNQGIKTATTHTTKILFLQTSNFLEDISAPKTSDDKLNLSFHNTAHLNDDTNESTHEIYILIPIRMSLNLPVPGTSFCFLFDIGYFPSSMEQRK